MRLCHAYINFKDLHQRTILNWCCDGSAKFLSKVPKVHRAELSGSAANLLMCFAEIRSGVGLEHSMPLVLWHRPRPWTELYLAQ
jgi:hypothetical protein